MQVEIQEIKIKEPVLSQALAMAEFQSWLDFKQSDVELHKKDISEDESEYVDELEDGADGKDETAIIQAIMTGHLKIDSDTKVMTYSLRFPIFDDTGVAAVKEIKLNPRMSAAQYSACVNANVQKEPLKMFVNVISVLSGEVKGIIAKFDSKDFSLLQKIAGYFL